ncbi:hypothetical protein HPE56_05880 [Maribacter sp. ANRC-HE7]|uniref:Uncharacterized protein n=1 Tax=Maribacter aquimaris TaxID=2737171 RepID=A0ABR7V0S9_9FLAO|nr:hypothetical protein [Maribacter aquimaris]MBD0777316.1 hypothetical protein [Maribacter aquimaris]
MKTVKYKDKDREFEMPPETFVKAFPKEVMLALLNSKESKLTKYWNYFKSLPFIYKILSYLKTYA